MSCRYLDTRALQEWLMLGTSTLSFLGSAVLTALCLKLRRMHPQQLLPLQLLQLGVVDLLTALWAGWTNVYVLLDRDHSPLTWCGVYSFIHRWLMVCGLVFSVCLAVGLLCQVRRWEIPTSLWYSSWFAIPLAFVLNIGYIVYPSVPDYSKSALLCRGSGQERRLSAGFIFTWETIITFIATIIIHATMVSQAYQASPHSVARRSSLSASRYVLAFICTYAIFIFYHLWEFVDPNSKENCVWIYLRILGTAFANLNGFFNFLAFWIHVSRIRQRRRQARSVGFHGQDSLEEVQEIPHGESIRLSVPKRKKKSRSGASGSGSQISGAPSGSVASDAADQNELGSFLVELFRDPEEGGPSLLTTPRPQSICELTTSAHGDAERPR